MKHKKELISIVPTAGFADEQNDNKQMKFDADQSIDKRKILSRFATHDQHASEPTLGNKRVSEGYRGRRMAKTGEWRDG